MIYAGVSPPIRACKRAVKWIQQHYTLDENPGLGQFGVYYYYHAFAKALDVMGQDEIEDADDTSIPGAASLPPP